MRTEYAIEGLGGFKHWSDAYGSKSQAVKAAIDLTKGKWRHVQLLKRVPLPPGHEIGARWELVEIYPISK